jgi:Ran GTPase-activating protein (RanGAP) involved in mRNA processing and transport
LQYKEGQHREFLLDRSTELDIDDAEYQEAHRERDKSVHEAPSPYRPNQQIRQHRHQQPVAKVSEILADVLGVSMSSGNIVEGIGAERTSGDRRMEGFLARRCILVLGPAASGKTTLTKVFIMQVLEHWPMCVPILIPVIDLVRVFTRRDNADTNSILSCYLKLKYSAHFHFLMQAVLQKRVLFLIDGIDESGAAQEQISFFVTEEILGRGHRVIVTSRHTGFSLAAFRGAHCRVVELLPLSPEQQVEMVRLRVPSAEHAERLVKELQRADFGEISSNPLMLTMAISIFLSNDHQLVASQAGLYEKALRTMMGRVDQLRKGVAREQHSRVWGCLQCLAFASHQRKAQRRIFTDRQALDWVSDPSLWSSVKAMVDQGHLPILVSLGLNNANEEEWRLNHLSFEEFLTAREIIARLTSTAPTSVGAAASDTTTFGVDLKVAGSIFGEPAHATFCDVRWQVVLRMLADMLLASGGPDALVKCASALLQPSTICFGGGMRKPGAQALAPYLKASRTLRFLDLKAAEIDCEGSRILGEALCENTAVESVILEDADLRVQMLRSALKVDLHSCKLFDQDCAFISVLLRHNAAVQKVKLSGCTFIHAEGLADSLAMLKSPPNMSSLDLANVQHMQTGSNQLERSQQTSSVFGKIKGRRSQEASFESGSPDDFISELFGKQGAVSVSPRDSASPHADFSRSASFDIDDQSAQQVGILMGTEPRRQLTCLNLSGIGFSDFGAEQLAHGLSDRHAITELDISHNRFGARGKQLLADAMQRCGSGPSSDPSMYLTTSAYSTPRQPGACITLEAKGLEYEDGCLLVQTMKNAEVRRLALANNFLGHSKTWQLQLAEWDNRRASQVAEWKGLGNMQLGETRMISLDLSHNCLSRESAVDIAQILAISSNLTELQLADNFLGSDGAIVVAKACARHASITSLQLRGNQIASNCFEPLFRTLSECSMLTAIDLSHNCFSFLRSTPGNLLAFPSLCTLPNSMTAVNLSSNALGESQHDLVCHAMMVRKQLVFLDVTGNHGSSIFETVSVTPQNRKELLESQSQLHIQQPHRSAKAGPFVLGSSERGTKSVLKPTRIKFLLRDLNQILDSSSMRVQGREGQLSQSMKRYQDYVWSAFLPLKPAKETGSCAIDGACLMQLLEMLEELKLNIQTLGISVPKFSRKARESGQSNARPNVHTASPTDAEQGCMELEEMRTFVCCFHEVYQSWIYLHPVFQIPDVPRFAPMECNRFMLADKAWRKLMIDAQRMPLRELCTTHLEGMLETKKVIDLASKGLTDYLNSKRMACPRLFFVSDEDLLTMLSKSKTPRLIDLSKIFESVQSLIFTDDGMVATAMAGWVPGYYNATASADGAKGETVPFAYEQTKSKPVCSPSSSDGQFEVWLEDLLRMMRISVAYAISTAWIKFRVSLTDVRGRCHFGGLAERRVLLPLLANPAMVVLVVNALQWTRETEQAMLVNGLQQVVSSRMQLVEELARRNRDKVAVDKVERIKINALVTMLVYHRDVSIHLSTKSTDSACYDWSLQCRLYWEVKETSNSTDASNGNPNWELNCKLLDSIFKHGMEYIGARAVLVHTPLTDRCYRSMLCAVNLQRIGMNVGPAGTGKTETVKDLASFLGTACFVLNCSDRMDHRSLAKIFMGCAASGVWTCFDEFNRIDAEVLSVIGEQVRCILRAKAQGADEIDFEGYKLMVTPSANIFVTLNPGKLAACSLHSVLITS